MVHLEWLFDLDGSLYVPRPLTRGGWSPDAQHGSPPAGLLARTVEQVPTAAAMQVVRFTVDLFRPVPLTPLALEAIVLRDGRRIQVVEARMRAEEVEIGRATALKVRLESEDAAAEEISGTAGDDPPPSALPEELPILDWRGVFGELDDLERFHTDGVEIRTVDDSFVRPVPGESWFRLRTGLVTGEEITPFQRAAICSDLANGNSQALDPMRWNFVNPDITLYLHRPAVGEWIGMRSVAHQGHHGVGVTESRTYDLEGRFGHVSQAQILGRR